MGHPWVGGDSEAGALPCQCLAGGGQVKSCLGRLKAIVAFTSVSQIVFLPGRAATPCAGDPISGSRTLQCPGRSMGISERHFRPGPLFRGKAAAVAGRAGTGPRRDGQGNLHYYVDPLPGSESQDAARRYHAGKREMRSKDS